MSLPGNGDISLAVLGERVDNLAKKLDERSDSLEKNLTEVENEVNKRIDCLIHKLDQRFITNDRFIPFERASYWALAIVITSAIGLILNYLSKN